MKNTNQILISVLLVLMLCVCNLTSTVYAMDDAVLPAESIFDKMDISKYWSEDSKTAPAKEGYVFGGWYVQSGSNYVPLKESDITTGEGGKASLQVDAYAKFVPSYVLSVKAQIDVASQNANQASGDNGKAFLRLLSSVDSTSYQEVGFDLFYDKTVQETENTVFTKVYSEIKNSETKNETLKPSDAFGSASQYFSILKVDAISNDNCDNILYVRPFWKTMDGTRVTGLSKYVRVMDGYNNNRFISVPVNLGPDKLVAVGSMNMKYDNTILEYVGFEPGVLLPDMKVDTSTSGVIKMIGSTEPNLGNQSSGSAIYANVWFKVISGGETLPHCNFNNGDEIFCNWAEERISDIWVQDIHY